MEFELKGAGRIEDVGIGDELYRDGSLLIDFSANREVSYGYFDLEQVKQLKNHLQLVLDKHENGGVTIYDKIAAKLTVEDAKNGLVKMNNIDSGEIARVIRIYKELEGQ